MKNKDLIEIFVPIATFDNTDQDDQSLEMVALMEGLAMPFFGIAYSIEKNLFNTNLLIDNNIDHSPESI